MIDPSLLEPFWTSTVMRRESLFLVSASQGGARARLIFPPEQVLSLTSAAGDVQYEERRDNEVDITVGEITCPLGSRVPCTTLPELYPSVNAGGSAFMYRRDQPETYLMSGEDSLFHRRQILATYTHRGDIWKGPSSQFSGAHLPHTLQRLVESTPLTICVIGDSISEGYNASGFLGVPPYQPSYGPLVMAGLERAYASPITFHNLAASGRTADDGVVDTARVAAVHPDLVIIAYGMNDAGYADAKHFGANIDAMMKQIQTCAPTVEFVLVSPMLPNPEWHYTVPERFPAYREALGQLCGPGVVLADLTSLWAELLKRKSIYDLSGNGINHPNDFGHRLYAQIILALLIDRR